VPERPLSPEDHALWSRVAATVRPIGRTAVPPPPVPSPAAPARPAAPAPERPRPFARPRGTPADTLDGGWDRRLRRGSVVPDRTLDLHGHTLASAQQVLEAVLADAVASDTRVLLVVTGKPPRGGEGRRGLIRAAIFDWLAQSPYGGAIAAVRAAHPRHGGAGALYLILRRRRGG